MNKLVVGLISKPDKMLVVDMLLSSGVRTKELANLVEANIDYSKGIALIKNTKNCPKIYVQYSPRGIFEGITFINSGILYIITHT